MLLKDICRAIDALCPFDTQEEWDNSGLQIGDPASEVKKALDIPMVRTVGAAERKISRVAVMGGAGSDFMVEAKALGADLYVTADLKYHDGQTAAEMGLTVMDAGHFATEVSVMEPFRQKMAAAMEGVEFLLAEGIKDFWTVR